MAFTAPALKSKLLIVELWGLGDLVIATPFLRAVAERFDVTLLAKPLALDLQPRFWPGVKVVAFTAPWTAFKNKYQLWRWPWRAFFRLRREFKSQHFAVCASSRWDPRDHLLMVFLGMKKRLGYPRSGSQKLLTQTLTRPELGLHRYEQWRTLGQALGLTLPPRPTMFRRAPMRPPSSCSSSFPACSGSPTAWNRFMACDCRHVSFCFPLH